MTKEELQQEILKLLKNSTIPDHDKRMVQILMPAMTIKILEDIYTSLNNEKMRMAQLDEKKKRIELKYKVMVEGLSNAKSSK